MKHIKVNLMTWIHNKAHIYLLNDSLAKESRWQISDHASSWNARVMKQEYHLSSLSKDLMTDESHPKLIHRAYLAFYLMKKSLEDFLRSHTKWSFSTSLSTDDNYDKITFRDHLLLAILCLCIKKDVQNEWIFFQART